MRSTALRLVSSAALVVPRGVRPRELAGRQRVALLVRGVVQLGLLATALRDLRTRPAAEIRGPKLIWMLVSGVNYLGVGPMAYFAFGRRRTARSTTTSGRTP
jgi:hypothetical protein